MKYYENSESLLIYWHSDMISQYWPFMHKSSLNQYKIQDQNLVSVNKFYIYIH